jgi:malate permease and related proteins
MMDILNVVLPIFIVILIGWLIGKFSKIDMSGIVDVLFWVGIPALAFSSMLGHKIVLADAGKVWASAIIVMAGCGITAWMVFSSLRRHHSGLYLPIILMNTVYIPFPIISLLYGSQGIFAAVLFYIPNEIAMYSIGVLILSGKNWKDGLKEMAKVPALYMAIAGIALNLLNAQVPDLILRPLDLIGKMVVPAALLVLGAKLASVKITSLPTTAIASVIRLGIGLALGFAVVGIFHLTGILRTVVLFESAMPGAVNTTLLAVKYDNESELVSSMVFLTTLASLVMIPFLVWMLA